MPRKEPPSAKAPETPASEPDRQHNAELEAYSEVSLVIW
jgi:hypothetical protein